MAGIIAKVWPVGGYKTSSSKQMGDSLEYITNDEKTKCEIPSIGNMVTSRNMRSEVKYVVNDVKTMNGALVGTHNVASVEGAFDEMMAVKRFYGKEGGRIALHGEISVEAFESTPENIPKLMMVCQDMLKELFPNNQAIFAVHTNTDNLHVHFFLNSVGLDGKKIHQPKGYIRKVLQPTVNKLAEKYGLTPNSEWGRKKTAYKTVEEMNYGEKKALLKSVVDKAVEEAKDFDGFIKEMQKQGVKVRAGKHLSLSMKGFKYPIRSGKLGDWYTIDSITNRILMKKSDFIYETATMQAETVEKKESPYVMKRMKPYKDMTQTEKRQIIRQLRLGRNPWQEYYASSWQKRRIADEMTRTENVYAVIKAYSPGNDINAALNQMIARQKSLAADKKRIKKNLKRYGAIKRIYEDMKPLMKKAFLYEENGSSLCRSAYEQYKELSRRLEKYGKTVEEVAEFFEEQDNELLYIEAQSREISKQYKTVKNFGIDEGLIAGKRIESLYELTGIKEAREMAQKGVYSSDYRYVYAEGSQVYLDITTAPTNKDGKTVMETVVRVIRKGEEIDSFSSLDKDFSDRLYNISRRYGLYDAQATQDIAIAKEAVDRAEKQKETKKTKNVR